MQGPFRRRNAFALIFGVAAGLLPMPSTPAVGAPAQPVPACFGAASRDAAQPCENPALRFRVSPTPRDAELQPGSACTLVATEGQPRRVCEFGVSKRAARETVGLLGDSHAPAWRGAMAGLFRAQRWRGLTVRRSSCPFSTTAHVTDGAGGEACFTWVRAATAFFARHVQIHTVFVVLSSAYRFRPGPDGDVDAAAVRGYREALDALPPSVRRIIVVRDNPMARDDTLGCVADAVARGRRADLRCAVPRASSLLPDPATLAATQLQGDRGHVIDLSSVFCDSTLCFPVVGGALIFRDKSHITQSFAASLSPLFERAFRALGLPTNG